MDMSDFPLSPNGTVRTNDREIDALLEDADDHFANAEEEWKKAVFAEMDRHPSQSHYLRAQIQMMAGLASQNQALLMWTMTDPDSAEKERKERVVS